MVDITEKHTSLRYAKAQAIVKVSKQETIDAIINKKVPKGDVLEFAKVAGLFGVKKTSELIPDCHPLPIEYTNVTYQIDGLKIYIFVEVKTIYRTGVEVEAMHGASVVALTMYDMLKPIDKGIELQNIKLIEKTGGKSDFKMNDAEFNALLIIYSDNVVNGKKEDKVSQALADILTKSRINLTETTIIAENESIVESYLTTNRFQKYNLVLIAGGTGITKKDTLPNLLQKYYDVSAISLLEASRNINLERDSKAMLSNGNAGIIDKTLVMNIPGSSKGAVDTLKYIINPIRHILENQEYIS